jgi:predicted nucleic acid binding AN1-type Zn finger protein
MHTLQLEVCKKTVMAGGIQGLSQHQQQTGKQKTHNRKENHCTFMFTNGHRKNAKHFFIEAVIQKITANTCTTQNVWFTET